MKAYGTRELVKLLTNLGYTKGKLIASRHLKYHCPNKIEKGKVDFILVILNRTEFDPYWRKAYVKQIKQHGFTQHQIEKAWK